MYYYINHRIDVLSYLTISFLPIIFVSMLVLVLSKNRLKTVLDSDKILVMRDGAVAEFSTPQLLASDKNSMFAQFLEIQHRREFKTSTIRKSTPASSLGLSQASEYAGPGLDREAATCPTTTSSTSATATSATATSSTASSTSSTSSSTSASGVSECPDNG
jgi:ABC-type sugar transport system ATPase subunit